MSNKEHHEKKTELNLEDQDSISPEEVENAPELDFPSRSDLENQLTAMEKKMMDYKSQSLRSHAELENVRRRLERDVTNAHKYGTERLINDLFPAMDSLIHGLAGVTPTDPKQKAMYDGMTMTLSMLEKALSKHGVEIIAPVKGDTFDPALHQAMSSISDPDAKPNTIVEVMQKGYKLNGRVLRAALVIVAQ